MNIRCRRLALIPLATLVALSACGGNNSATNGQRTQSGTEAQHGEQAQGSEPLTGQELDRAFIKGMVPHHAAAVEMSKAVLDKGTRAEVKELAQAIIDAQEPEITQMSDIAKEKYGFTPERQHHGAMGTLMGVPISMDMAKMAQQVSAAADPDMAFLMMMRPHHASAIVMANEEMQHGADPQLKQIADMIVADQSKEVGEIQEMLATGG